MKRIAAVVTIVLLIAAVSVIACEGEEVCRYVSAAWTRCLDQTVTLRFDDEHGNPHFVTIKRKDAERLHADLHAYIVH